MARKTPDTKTKKTNLLMEPSVEEERRANEHSFDFTRLRKLQPEGQSGSRMQATSDRRPVECEKARKDVISNTQEADWQRNRQKSSLTSLLMILFGSILLIGCLGVHSAQQIGQSGANKTNLSKTLGQSEVVKVIAPSSTTINSLESSPTNSTDSSLEASDDAEGDAEEELTEPAPANKQADLIVSTLTDAADLYISRLKANKEESESDEQPSVDNYSDSANLKPVNANDTSILREDAPNKRQTATGESQNPPEANDRTTEFHPSIETYLRWRQGGDEIIELFSKKLLPVIVEHGYDIDAVTVTGVLQVFNAIRGLKTWALRLIDSWAKLTPGLLVGTQSDFGDFDECLNVRADDPNGLAESNPDIPVEYDEATGLKTTTVIGKYCLADVIIPLPSREKLPRRNEELQTDYAPIELRRPLLNFSQSAAFKDTIFVETGNFLNMLYVDPIRVGFCITNKINEESFAKVFNILVEPLEIKIDFKGRCVTKYDRTPWTIQQRVSAWVLLTCCFLVVLSTILDILHTKLNKLPVPCAYLFDKQEVKLWKANASCKLSKYRPIFTSFSIIRNTKRLFKPQANKLLQVPSQQSLAVKSPGYSDSSTSGGSTPSIERRSSASGSDLKLICEPSISSESLRFEATKRGIVPSLTLQRASGLSREDDKLNLSCLHGVRVITMTWMIVNHTYLFGGFFVLWAHRRLIDIAEWPKSVSFQLVLNGWLTVETYFFLSALIIVLNIMPLFKARKFAYAQYIFHRLLRLLPAYVGLICLNFLWPLVSSGPVWLVKGKSFIQTPCENNLWTNFLFINNWIWPEKQCMVHTWFLSADLQLYLLAPIIVYLLYRRPVYGHSLNIFIAIVASLVSGLVIYANKLLPTTLINKLEFDSIKQQLSYSYFATYQHMGPYCLGILTGYLLHKRPRVRLPKHLTWALWLLLPPLSFTTLFLTYLWNGAYQDADMINPSPLVSAFYVAIHRTIWTALIAWIVFACSTGRAKILANFLSHSTFVPLSRLSFSIYLVHLPIIMFRALNLRHTVEWTDSNILWEACGNFIVSLIAGYFVNVTFESPFINLEAALLGRRPELGHSHSGGLCCCKGKPEMELRRNSNDLNDSEDTKSAETSSNSEQQSVGSPDDSVEQKKLAPQLNAGLHHPADWVHVNSLAVKPSLQRKALRPKQHMSVEKIFGHQLEPPCPEVSSKNKLEDSQEQPERVSEEDEVAYPEFDYQPAPKQHEFNQMSPLEARGSQYATLIGGNRFYRKQPMELDQQDRSIYSRPSDLYARKSQSQLGESPGSRYEHHWAGFVDWELERQQPGSRRHLANYARRKRQARYNTLTGAGPLEEWALRCAGPAMSRLDEPAGRWIQQQQAGSGLMIPRVDSSTLRMQQQVRRLEKSPAEGSIIEEPATLEEGRESAFL